MIVCVAFAFRLIVFLNRRPFPQPAGNNQAPPAVHKVGYLRCSGCVGYDRRVGHCRFATDYSDQVDDEDAWHPYDYAPRRPGCFNMTPSVL